jgi:hypothetical protein
MVVDVEPVTDFLLECPHTAVGEGVQDTHYYRKLLF